MLTTADQHYAPDEKKPPMREVILSTETTPSDELGNTNLNAQNKQQTNKGARLCSSQSENHTWTTNRTMELERTN